MPPQQILDLTSTSPEHTTDVARQLAGQLRGGDVLLLNGPLGAGKTWFVKGLAEGLGVADRRRVKSPSFVLMNIYHGWLRVVHIDAYRLDDAEDLVDLGSVEFLHDADTVVAIEWAEKVIEAIDEPYLEIKLSHDGPSRRRIHMQWTGEQDRTFRFDPVGQAEPHTE